MTVMVVTVKVPVAVMITIHVMTAVVLPMVTTHLAVALVIHPVMEIQM